MFAQVLQTENDLIINSFSNQNPQNFNPQIRNIGDYNNDGYTTWLIESSTNITPSEYNDNATIKYEGYTIKKIPRTQFKQYIRNRFLDFLQDDNIDYNLNNDCLDNRIKWRQKLSVPKLVQKVWDNERFNFLNDGFFLTKRDVYIIEFNYSMFNSQFETFN
jgi:hypothetical protein